MVLTATAGIAMAAELLCIVAGDARVQAPDVVEAFTTDPDVSINN